MHKLIIKTGPRKDCVFELTSDKITIGRGKDNLIIIPDPAVSRNHAQITQENDRFVVKDLKSTNGLFVNGKRVTSAVLDVQDELRVGDTIIQYTAELPTPEAGVSDKIMISTDGMLLKKYAADEIESKSATVLYREYQILSAFYNISKTLTALSDFKTTVKEALAVVLEMMKAENGFIFINNEKTGTLVPEIALCRETGEVIDFSRCSETIIKTAFKTGKSILTSDATQDDRFMGAQSVVFGNIKSVMCVPIRTQKKILGVMEIDTRKIVGGFTVDDLEILSVIAGHIAMCLENSMLYDDVKSINEKLTHLDEMKTKFITMAGHELATPLTIIDQYIIILKEKLFGPITEKQQKALEILFSRVSRLKKIIADVSKISTGKISFDKYKMPGEHFEINELLEETAKELRPLAEGRHQKFILRNLGKDLFVTANREGIREVLINLGVNAIKFTPDGGQIDISLFEEKERVRVEVKDTGIGIPSNQLDVIFDSFYKVEDVKHHHSGTVEFKAGGLGLGLAIVKQIVESQKGKVWVESEEGKGANFIFTIPKD